MNQVIISAIQNRHVLTLRYHGYSRVVEPHCYGRTTAGHDALRCWQTEGGSESGERQGWKLLLLRDVHQIDDTGANFEPRLPAYKRGDPAMSTIYAQL